MRIFNLIDLVGQTLIFGAILTASVLNVEGAITYILWGGMWIGSWQVISSVLTALMRFPLLRSRVNHLIASAVYLLCFVFVHGSDLLAIPGFGVPAVLAVFYYVITFKTFKSFRTRPTVLI